MFQTRFGSFFGSFFSRFSNRFSGRFKSFSGAVSFCRHAALNNPLSANPLSATQQSCAAAARCRGRNDHGTLRHKIAVP